MVSRIRSSGAPDGWWKKVGLLQQPVGERRRIGLLYRDPALPARAVVEPHRAPSLGTTPASAFLAERGQIELRGKDLVQASEHLRVVVLIDVDRGTAGIQAMLGRDDPFADDLALPALQPSALQTPLPSGESACDAGAFVHGGEYTRRQRRLPPAHLARPITGCFPTSYRAPAGHAPATGRSPSEGWSGRTPPPRCRRNRRSPVANRAP